jgi:hypothetical protein
MKRRQVFVRALDSNDKMGVTDVMDLDEDSFKVFMLDVMQRHGLVVGIIESQIEGERIALRTKPGIVHKED